MDPQSVNHTSRNFQLLVFCSKSLYFSGKTAHALFLTKHISRLTSDSLLRPCSPRNIFHFWDPKYTANLFRKYVIFGPFARAKYVIFGPKIHCQSVQNKFSFVIKLDLNQPKGFFSKKFQERLNWQRINLKQITNICFFMFGWKTNQWNPASEWNDFASQASKKVLL